MQTIHAQHAVSISELKKSPTAILKQARGEVVAILNHNKASAYLLSAEVYERIILALDDVGLASEVKKALQSGQTPVKVSLDEL